MELHTYAGIHSGVECVFLGASSHLLLFDPAVQCKHGGQEQSVYGGRLGDLFCVLFPDAKGD